MRLDLALTCRLVASHLDEDGVEATARGRELRLRDGPTFQLRAEGRPDDGSPGSLFWVDVVGLRLEPPMQLDLSGWGSTPEDCATDAAHGLLSAVIPPVRWLAVEPWRPPAGDAGHAQRFADEAGRPWTVVVGRPWVVVATAEPDGGADHLGAELSNEIGATPRATLDGLGAKVGQLATEPRGHWIKIYAARLPDGELSCRIDIDNQVSIESRPFAETIPWRPGSALQIVRQLLVLRPDGEPPRPEAPGGSGPAVGRLRRLLGRA